MFLEEKGTFFPSHCTAQVLWDGDLTGNAKLETQAPMGLQKETGKSDHQVQTIHPTGPARHVLVSTPGTPLAC